MLLDTKALDRLVQTPAELGRIRLFLEVRW